MQITIADPEVMYQKYLRPFVTTTDWMNNSREIAPPELPMSPRELFGLLVMNHLMNYMTDFEWRPGVDPFGKDGVIVRLNDDPKERAGVILEQTFVNDFYTEKKIEQSIAKAIRKKEARGHGYTDGESLVVLCNREGSFTLNQLVDEFKNSPYLDIALIGPIGNHQLKMQVVLIKTVNGTNPRFVVEIDPVSGSGKVADQI